MWRQVFDWFKALFTLSQDMAHLQQEHLALKQRLEEHADVLQQLVSELQTLSATERLERENLMLRLKVELLEFRQALPPALPPTKKPTEDGPTN